MKARRATTLALSFAVAAAPAARACEVALLLTMDVSGSVDRGEYRTQVDGLAAALTDPQIADVLVRDQVALAVMQWSGVDQQAISLPWRRMLRPSDVPAFAARVRGLQRAFANSDTAVGDALIFAADRFGPVADCERLVIDISGDGATNAGGPTGAGRRAAIARGIEINAVAIEGLGLSISAFYRRAVITRDGFVMSARGHLEYARTIRAKILRELVRPSG